MPHRPSPAAPVRLALALACLAACASAPPRAAAPPTHATTRAPPPMVAEAPAPPAPREIAVRAQPPESLEFNITASSDLPPGVSTAGPFEHVVEGAVAPLRPALAECMRALGAPARRFVRVTLVPDGTILPRPPQAWALPPRDASCVDGVLRAATLDPPPPRPMPYDIRVDVAR